MDEDIRAAFADLKTDIRDDIHTIQQNLDRVESRMEKEYTLLERFLPVRNVVYWAVTAVASGAITIAVAIIIRALNTGAPS